MDCHIPCKHLLDTCIGVRSSCANHWTRDSSSSNQRHSAWPAYWRVGRSLSIIVFWTPSARLNAPALNSCQIGEALGGARKGVERSTVMSERRRKNASEVQDRLARTGTLIPTGRDGARRRLRVRVTPSHRHVVLWPVVAVPLPVPTHRGTGARAGDIPEDVSVAQKADIVPVRHAAQCGQTTSSPSPERIWRDRAKTSSSLMARS